MYAADVFYFYIQSIYAGGYFTGKTAEYLAQAQ